MTEIFMWVWQRHTGVLVPLSRCIITFKVHSQGSSKVRRNVATRNNHVRFHDRRWEARGNHEEEKLLGSMARRQARVAKQLGKWETSCKPYQECRDLNFVLFFFRELICWVYFDNVLEHCIFTYFQYVLYFVFCTW